MVIDKALIKQIYLENNSKFFDNKLQTTSLEFRIDHSVNNLGGCYFIHKKNKLHIVIYISDMYEWDRNSLMLILLHEMIHVYLYMNFNDSDRNHTSKFKKVCKELFDKYHITVPLNGSFLRLTDDGLKNKNAIKKTNNIFLIALNYIVNKFF